MVGLILTWLRSVELEFFTRFNFGTDREREFLLVMRKSLAISLVKKVPVWFRNICPRICEFLRSLKERILNKSKDGVSVGGGSLVSLEGFSCGFPARGRVLTGSYFCIEFCVRFA